MPDTVPASTRDALRQAVKPAASAQPSPTPAPSPEPSATPADDLGRQDKTYGVGDYDRKLVEDLEAKLSTLSPEQRKLVEPLVADFRKPYDKAFHKALSEIAELKRKFEAAPAKSDSPAVQEAKDAKKELRGLYQDLEEETDPVVKEKLRKGIARLEDHITEMFERLAKPFTEKLDRFEQSSVSERSAEASAMVDALEDEQGYPPALVEKYRRRLVENYVRYPQYDMEEILSKTVPFAELKPILRATSTASEERPKKGKATPASVASQASEEGFDEKTAKNVDGRWDIKRMLASSLKR